MGGEGDLARLEAVRQGAPETDIIIDANEGWDAQTYRDLAPVLVDLGVRMVEQPMPAGDDDALREVERVLPVCADEACHGRHSVPSLAMAPATLVAQGVAYTDLDGPLLLAEDRPTPLNFDDKFVYPPEPALWG